MSSKRRFSHKQPRSFAPAGFLALFCVAALLWAGLWYLTSLRFQKQLDEWIAAERATGHEMTFSGSGSGGSPLAVTRQFHNLHWKNGKGATLKSDYALVSTRLWDWRSIEISFPRGAETVIPLPGQKETISIKGEDALLTIGIPFIAPKDHASTGLSLSLEGHKLALKTEKPQPFGNVIAKAGIELRVTGNPPDFSSRDSVAAWNASSGVIEFDAFDLDWGDLKLAMKGTLGLDGKLQPEGAFSGQIGDRKAVVNALAGKKWISKNDAGLLNQTLDQINRPSAAGGKLGAEKKPASGEKTAETVPLTVQSGALFLGPVRVLTIPPLVWK